MLFCLGLNELVSVNPGPPGVRSLGVFLLSGPLHRANPADQSVQFVQFVPHSSLLNLAPMFPWRWLPASPQHTKKVLALQLNRIMSE